MWEIYTFAGLYVVCSILKNWWWFKMVIGPEKKEDKEDEIQHESSD